MAKRVLVRSEEQNGGGLEHRFVEEVPEKFICSICTKVQCEPHLTSCCGQHFCESCLENWFKKQGKKSCPHCREKRIIHIVNKALIREINELKIHCTHQGEGCQWIGELGNLQTHLDSESGCGYEEVECTNCWHCSIMKRKDLQEHLSSECPKRTYQCEHCDFEDTYEEITIFHYDECPEYPLDCPNECGAEAIQRKDMSSHRAECPEELVECPNGCDGESDGNSESDGDAVSVGDDRVEVALLSENEAIFGELPFADQGVEYEEEFKCRTLKRKDLSYHLSNECYLRKCKCEHCGHEDTYEKITGIRDGERQEGISHYELCPEYPFDCPNECGAEPIKKKEMPTHRDKCPLEPMVCPFEEAGCETKLVRRDFDDHISTQTQQHLLLTFRKMTALSTNYDALRKSHDTLKENYDTLSEEHYALSEEHYALSEEHHALSEEHHALNESHNTLNESHNNLTKSHDMKFVTLQMRCDELEQKARQQNLQKVSSYYTRRY